jgi:hypothetical protein
MPVLPISKVSRCWHGQRRLAEKTKKIASYNLSKSNYLLLKVVRTNDLKGRRGRLPTKPKSPNSVQASSRTQQSTLLAQIARLYTETVPIQSAYDFSKVSLNNE